MTKRIKERKQGSVSQSTEQVSDENDAPSARAPTAQHPSSTGDQNFPGMGLVATIILQLLYALYRGCDVQGRGHGHPNVLLLTPHQGATPVSAGEIAADRLALDEKRGRQSGGFPWKGSWLCGTCGKRNERYLMIRRAAAGSAWLNVYQTYVLFFSGDSYGTQAFSSAAKGGGT